MTIISRRGPMGTERAGPPHGGGARAVCRARYEQTTVAEIAERAGLTKRTFFRHYGDKREVLFPAATRSRTRSSTRSRPRRGCRPARRGRLEHPGGWRIAGGRHAFARRRAAVIAANPSLQERELVKLATVAAALAAGLRARGVPEPAASLDCPDGHGGLPRQLRALGRRRPPAPADRPDRGLARRAARGRPLTSAALVRPSGACKSVRRSAPKPHSVPRRGPRAVAASKRVGATTPKRGNRRLVAALTVRMVNISEVSGRLARAADTYRMNNPLRAIVKSRRVAAVALGLAIVPFAASTASAAPRAHTSKHATSATATTTAATTTTHDGRRRHHRRPPRPRPSPR